MSANLGKMVGPLPLGAWMAVVGGGLGFALYTRKQTAAATPPTVVDSTSGMPGVGTGGSGQWQDLSVPTTGSGSSNVAGPPQTNEDWGVLAINWLISQGYDPAIADSAVRKYLGLEALSAQEFAMVTAALAHLGAPPQILPPPIFAPPGIPTPPVVSPGGTPAPKPPVVSKPPPKPKPPAPRPRARTYTVQHGDTLWGIAVRYYHNGFLWPRIWNANRGQIRNPNLIYPGQVLTIP